MDIKYKILGLDKSSLCITVNFYSDEVPQGLTYNIDLPLDVAPKGQQLHSFILLHSPKMQLARMAQVKKANLDTKELETMIQIGLENKPVIELADMKLLAKTMISEKLERELLNGVVYRGHRFDAGRTSLSILSSVITSIDSGNKLPDGFTWRSTANNNISMNPSELKELHRLMVDHINNTYKVSWSKKEQIESARSLEEVNAVKWVVLGDMHA